MGQSHRAELSRLRSMMTGQGQSVDEIATAVRARYGYSLRAAYRHAMGWTLDQAAERYNHAADDADARLSGPRLSEWENWPQTGTRRPTAFNLLILSKVYSTHPSRLVTYDEEQCLDHRERALLRQLHESHPAVHDDAAIPGRASAASPMNTAQPSDDLHALASAAAGQSLEFANRAELTNTSDETVEQLRWEISSLAIDYVHSPLVPVFHHLVATRDVLFTLLNGRQRPRHTRELFFLAGTTCLLLAHASQNLGDHHAALAQLRSAGTCADQADHDGLRAWARGTAALIAEWSSQQNKAVALAEQGTQLVSSGQSRIRLAAVQARSAARIGDRDHALAGLAVLHDADTIADGPDDLAEFGGLLSFPRAKQQYYIGSTYALLGEYPAAEDHAGTAITLYENGPPEHRSYGDEALARLDIVNARLCLGDLDGARAALEPVLTLPEDRHIHQIDTAIARTCSLLRQHPYTRDRAARELIDRLTQYLAPPRVQALRCGQ